MLGDPLSHGLWDHTAPAAPPTYPLRKTTTCDVAIVGGGFTGLSAALRLAENGVSTVLLEAHEIGHGGSGRNVGLVNTGLWTMPDALPQRLGEGPGERLLELLGDAPAVVFNLIRKHGIACEAEMNGTLHCAVGRGGLRQLAARAQQWQARGAPVFLLDSKETAERIGSTRFSGALLDERAGTIQPLAYARGLAAAAIDAGAHVHTASAVIRVEQDGPRWRLFTRLGSVLAERVIVATNAYSDHTWPQLRAELVQLPYFNFSTPPLPESVAAHILRDKQGIWDTRRVLTSLRRDREGRLVIGSVGALNSCGHAVHRAWALRTMRRIFPVLDKVNFENGWFGQIGMTVDKLPRYHKLAHNMFGICGYNGRGIAPGTVFGQRLANYLTSGMLSEVLPLPMTEPKPVKFRRTREAAYRAGALAYHLF